jgi:hypothetical protein
MGLKRTWMIAAVAAMLIVAGCGGDDDGGSDTPATTAAPSDAGTSAPSGDDEPAPPSGGNGGEVVLGDETITFDSARCFLEEQDAAAGGGKILFVAQAFGTNAAGEQVAIDVSRYDEDSQFVGDDIIVDIGDPFSDDLVSYLGGSEDFIVSLDGSTVSADGLTFRNFDDDTELSGSFRIDC